MVIIVTGASGFLGRLILPRLLDRGHHIVTAGRSPVSHGIPYIPMDFMQPALVMEAADQIRSVRADCIIHLAWIARPPQFWTSLENLDCLAASLELLKSLAASAVHKFIGVGSCAEYGDGDTSAISEAYSMRRPTSTYGHAKNALFEIAMSAKNELAPMSFSWARLFYVYGEGEPAQKLITSMITSFREGCVPDLREPDRRIDLIYADDVAEALVQIAESDVAGAINVGTGVGISIREVAVMIAALVAPHLIPSVVSLPKRIGRPDVVANASLLKNTIGFTPTMTLEEGVRRIIQTTEVKRTK